METWVTLIKTSHNNQRGLWNKSRPHLNGTKHLQQTASFQQNGHVCYQIIIHNDHRLKIYIHVIWRLLKQRSNFWSWSVSAHRSNNTQGNCSCFYFQRPGTFTSSERDSNTHVTITTQWNMKHINKPHHTIVQVDQHTESALSWLKNCKIPTPELQLESFIGS